MLILRQNVIRLLKNQCIGRLILNKTHSYEWVSFWWNWWVSNPRPNKESKSFLHVCLILIFEIEVEISNQTLFLSSKSFASLQKK